MLKADFRSEISNSYEQKAKSCLTCDVQGSCCLDAHFVNVHISRLEAVAITKTLDSLPEEKREAVYIRAREVIKKYDLKPTGNTYEQTFACPLFEKGTGCLVHSTAKPLPCITHACYENPGDLPPDELLAEMELQVEELNVKTSGKRQPWLPLPLAVVSVARP